MSAEKSIAKARTWLITGASSGLGYALAEYVLQRGDRVAMGARTLLRRVPLALSVVLAWILVERLHLGTRLDAVSALVALAIAQCASAVLSSLAERGQMLVKEPIRQRHELFIPAVIPGLVAADQEQRRAARIECEQDSIWPSGMLDD